MLIVLNLFHKRAIQLDCSVWEAEHVFIVLESWVIWSEHIILTSLVLITVNKLKRLLVIKAILD